MLASVTMAPTRSDALLIAIASTTTVIAIVAAAAETAQVAAIGVHGGFETTSWPDIVHLIRRVFLPGLLLVVPSTALVVGLFTASAASPQHTWDEFARFSPVAIVPFIAVLSTSFSAYLIAQGTVELVLLSNGLRSLPVLAAVVLSAPDVALISAVIVGEVLRFLMLFILARRATSGRAHQPARVAPASSRLLTLRGLLFQSIWISLSQLNLTLLRAVFASGSAGTFTAGEIAIRVQNVSSQVAISGYVMNQVSAIPARYAGLDGYQARRSAIRAILAALRSGALISLVVGIGSLCGAWILRDSPLILTGLLVGAVLALTCGPLAASTYATRLIVFKQRNLPLVIVGAGMTLLLFALLQIASAMGSTLWVPTLLFVLVISLGAFAYAAVSTHYIRRDSSL